MYVTKFYSLKRTSDGKKLFISKDDMSVLTDNPEEALPFFSKNHIQVWKKCNPTFTDTTMVEMLKDDGTIKEITTVKEKIILHDKYSHDKINDDEFYREVLIYKVDGKIAYMMSVIEGDGYSRAYNMDSDTYFNPEDHEDYSDEIPKDVLDELVELACKQIEIDYEEATIEEMTRKFIKRNGEELFRSFANTIVGMMHSDKWSVTYDWTHDNFTFLEGEKDGQIITKFVELVETNKL